MIFNAYFQIIEQIKTILFDKIVKNLQKIKNPPYFIDKIHNSLYNIKRIKM